ncbi:hypothetical protein Hypma_010669 [Hypsizygus marmoreus]|uniref:DUF6589 domain-containing protein n=1 Tax=Hypsizygus marmoreus TaxID=39966 RepID=A0A369JJB6_HYPMA|nr:hypothetical protein Hypma_010669 [Hypsizygus marmoreus]
MDYELNITLLAWCYQPETITPEKKLLAIIDILKELRMSPMDLVLEALGGNPAFKANRDGFYKGQGFEKLMNVMEAEPTGKKKIQTWMRPRAINTVVDEVNREMEALNEDALMYVKQITPEYLTGFHLQTNITDILTEKSPWLQRILLAAAQTPRAARENVKKDPIPGCSMIHAQLSNMRSQNNNFFAIPTGFFFYSCGMSRKAIDMLSRIGLCPSYQTIHKSHLILADGQVRNAQLVARGPHMSSWDNIHVSYSTHVEQRPLGPPKVLTGTASLIYCLRAATMEALQLKPILARRATCDMITFKEDLRVKMSHARDINQHFAIDVVAILTNNQAGFDYLDDAPELVHRSYFPYPAGYKTRECVLRTSTIDEGSVDGTIKVHENIFIDQLQFGEYDLDNQAIPSFNDQKTNALIRAAQLLRAQDLSSLLRLNNYQLGVGWFHAQLNLIWSILRIHRGTASDIGSLQYYISLLGKVRLGTEHPDYETLVSLARQVLHGHMLHYWEVETGMSLAKFAVTKPTATRLLEIANTILEKYASSASALRFTAETPSDKMFANTVLLNRDLLIFFELDFSISSGDFGRVEILLTTLTMMFTGAGCKNYSSEMLHFIQNLKKVWTPDFADIMRKNSLISVTGHVGHCVGVDKNAEFNINFQKHWYAAKGIHATWEQLANLAPNVPIYRTLKKQFTQFMGAPWQGTSHTDVSCSKLVLKVKEKAEEFQIHLPDVPKRAKTTRPTVDVIMKGKEVLQESGLKSFAKRYKAWVEDGEAFEIEEDDEV